MGPPDKVWQQDYLIYKRVESIAAVKGGYSQMQRNMSKKGKSTILLLGDGQTKCRKTLRSEFELPNHQVFKVKNALTNADFKRIYFLVKADFFQISTQRLLVDHADLTPHEASRFVKSAVLISLYFFMAQSPSTPCLYKSQKVQRFTHMRLSNNVIHKKHEIANITRLPISREQSSLF